MEKDEIVGTICGFCLIGAHANCVHFCACPDCKNFPVGVQSSGHIARHDPELMARAQRAGELCEKYSQYSIMAIGISDSDTAFIFGILAAVRDGKT